MNWPADSLPSLKKRVRGVSVQGGKGADSRSKFGNVKTEVDGIKLDSKREAKRWKELRLLLRSGRLLWLARQVEFILAGGIIYKADFVYWDGDMAKKFTVEDAKGYLTPEYRMKKKLMAERGFEIVEV